MYCRPIEGLLSARVLAAALVAALIVLASGCDGGSSTGARTTGPTSATTTKSSTAAPLTKAQFIARSEGFCKSSWRRMLHRFAAYKHDPRNAGKSASELFARATGDIFLPTILFWYDDINLLSPPKGESARIEKLLRGLQSTAETALDRPYSFHSPTQLAALYRRSNHLVRSYGIKSCVVTKTSFSR